MNTEPGERIKLSKREEAPASDPWFIDAIAYALAILVILCLLGVVVIAFSIIGIWLLAFGLVPTAAMVYVLSKV